MHPGHRRIANLGQTEMYAPPLHRLFRTYPTCPVLKDMIFHVCPIADKYCTKMVGNPHFSAPLFKRNEKRPTLRACFCNDVIPHCEEICFHMLHKLGSTISLPRDLFLVESREIS